MGVSFIVFGWLGILVYLIVLFTANQLQKNGETALLHLLICLAFVFFTPLPLYLILSNHSQFFVISSVFGFLFLIMIITTMALQVGHLSYSNNQDKSDKWEDRDNWMIHGMLGDVFESVVNVIFHIWILLLAVGFIIEKKYVIGILMAIFSLLIIRSLGILFNVVVKKPISFLRNFKLNPIVTTLETILFFLVIVCWATF
jgi:hypothetical protein